MVFAWTGAHCTFAVTRNFFKISESVIAIKRAFPAHFMLSLNYAVPDRK